ncbi:MAG: universal stress protein [Hyphomicrobiales bacterium]
MRRFKNLLAVYGDTIGADDVFCQAVALARANEARLTLVDVLPERYATSAGLAERRKRLSRLIPAVSAEGVSEVSVEVLFGTPFLEIIRQVLADGHDLVIASADDGASLRNAYFGSTATHLMRKCPCPVWVVKPDRSTHYTSILAAIDPKTDGASGTELDRKILDLATSLATSNDAGLHIVHAWDVEGKDRDTLASEVREDTRTLILRTHERLHRDRVNALLEGYDLKAIPHHLHMPRGMPQQAIVDLVDAHDVDLIVMGTVSRTGIPGLIIGNAAETVLSVVRCGVLTVKPEGFVTPVTLERELEAI